jgi:hypothetical protein
LLLAPLVLTNTPHVSEMTSGVVSGSPEQTTGIPPDPVDELAPAPVLLFGELMVLDDIVVPPPPLP